MSEPNQYLIIGGNLTTNLITTRLIRICKPYSIILSITDAEMAIAFIREYDNSEESHLVVFLDIDMPGIDGWGLLNQLYCADECIKHQHDFYILSSSNDGLAQKKARIYQAVKAVLLKPLDAESIRLAVGG